MKLGDKVIITSKFSNCEDVSFYGLTGKIIGIVSAEESLVLFDMDICGLGIKNKNCDHNFVAFAKAQAKKNNNFIEGGYSVGRNQRFFGRLFLSVLDTQPNTPINNDGREHCFWCGKPTKTILGITNKYNVCPFCNR